MKNAARLTIAVLLVVVGGRVGAASAPQPTIPGGGPEPQPVPQPVPQPLPQPIPGPVLQGVPQSVPQPTQQSVPIRTMPAVKTPQLDECTQLSVSSVLTGSLTATALGPFAIRLTWTAPPGDYTLTSGGDDPSFQQTFHHSAPIPLAGATVQGAPTTSKSATMSRESAAAIGKAPIAPAPAGDPTGSMIQEPTLPSTTYSYLLRATLPDGRNVCTHATATTPAPPPPTALRGTYVDARNVTIGMTAPPYARLIRVLRDSRVVATQLGNGANAGPQGLAIPDFRVDRPGAPPVPYTFANGKPQYHPEPPAYDFVIETTWQIGSYNATRVLQTPLRVIGPAPVVGFADLHSHQFSYLGFGGNPQTYPLGRHFVGKAFGPIDVSLGTCIDRHGPLGIFDLGNFAMHLAGGLPVPIGHPVGGVWQGTPYFDGWPRWDSFTHQQVYEDWLKRAHDKGLQLMVTHAVNNAWMCATLNSLPFERQAAVYGVLGVTAASILAAPTPETITAAASSLVPALSTLLDQTIVQQATVSDPTCRDIDATENQINEAFAMQNDIDARSGGPGRGWYRIVGTPAEARDVIRQGKLAVVLGVEVDNLFDCAKNGRECTPAFVDNILSNYYTRGVRHIFPVHFYDNQFGGSASTNALISKRFRNPSPKVPCQIDDPRGRPYGYDGGLCNGNGLTPLGNQLISGMMNRGMIVDVDHMSQHTFSDTMNLVTPRMYPVVSSHSGFTEINIGDQFNEGNRSPGQMQKILAVGGMFTVIPHQGDLGQVETYVPSAPHPRINHTCGNSSETVAQAFLYAVDKTGGGPVAFGSDFNGYAGWPGPRTGPEACPGGKTPNYVAKPLLDYNRPIVATGVQIPMSRSVIGQKTFDLNTDGLAHVGMLPDMIADFQAMGMGPSELDSMFESAEGYIRVWERATYISGGQ
jgi:microsomal dipeptidase-like Zn-dependent dipeptidase